MVISTKMCVNFSTTLAMILGSTLALALLTAQFYFKYFELGEVINCI
jgi:hypothetical protein